MIRFSRNISEKSFLKNIFTLTFGTAFSSILIIIAEPIVSRLFPPSAFGMVSTFYSFVFILGMIGCLKYEIAIVLPKDDDSAANLFVLCFIILSFYFLFTIILTCFFGDQFFSLLNIDNSLLLKIIFPLAIFLTGFEMLLRRWLTRKINFSTIAISRTMQSLPRLSGEILGGAIGYNSACHLALYRILGLAGTIWVLLNNFIKNDLSNVLKNFNFRSALSLSRRYIKFPTFELLSSLFMMISFHSPIILISYYFGVKEAGLFSKAFYLLYMPTMLLGDSIGQALLQHSAEKKNQGEDVSELVEWIYKQLINYSFFPFTIIAFIGPELFGIILGHRWVESGIYSQIIAMWLFAALFNQPISNLYGAFEKQDIGMFFNSILLFSRLFVLILGGVFINDPKITILFFSIVSTIIICAKIFYINNIIKVSSLKTTLHLLYTIFFYSPCILFLIIYRLFESKNRYFLVSILTASVIIYIYKILNDLKVKKE